MKINRLFYTHIMPGLPEDFFQGFYQLFHLISFHFPLRVCHKLSSPVEARNFSVVRTCVIR